MDESELVRLNTRGVSRMNRAYFVIVQYECKVRGMSVESNTQSA